MSGYQYDCREAEDDFGDNKRDRRAAPTPEATGARCTTCGEPFGTERGKFCSNAFHVAPEASAPEPRPHDVRYFVAALAEAAQILGNTNGLDTKLLASAHLLNHYAEQARASVAPEEHRS